MCTFKAIRFYYIQLGDNDHGYNDIAAIANGSLWSHIIRYNRVRQCIAIKRAIIDVFKEVTLFFLSVSAPICWT